MLGLLDSQDYRRRWVERNASRGRSTVRKALKLYCESWPGQSQRHRRFNREDQNRNQIRIPNRSRSRTRINRVLNGKRTTYSKRSWPGGASN